MARKSKPKQTDEICCPKCGKVCGGWDGKHVRIDKLDLLVIGAMAMPKKCSDPECGYLFDMMQVKGDPENGG